MIEANWPASPNVVAGCTTRDGGVSKGSYESLNLGAHVGDDIDAVRENRARLVENALLPAEPAWLDQVHGTDVAIEPVAGQTADAAISRAARHVCVVMVADCLPVLFANRSGTEVGAAHAGWRGLAGGVLERTVRAFESEPGELLAWMGPAISQAAFEVGEEVRAEFLARDPGSSACFIGNEGGRWQADLYGLARRRLFAAGVDQVFGGGFCTCGDPARFFSFRRDGQCGRMAAFIFRKY
jgi:hypothetical protein